MQNEITVKQINKEKEQPKKVSGVSRYIYICVGMIFLVLGFVGLVLPFVPTTPAVIVAAICFAKSSNKLYTWFVNTSLYKNNFEKLVKDRSMTLIAKLKFIGTISVAFGLSYFVMYIASTPLISRVVLVIIWSIHVLYFGFKIKTIPR